MSIQKINFIHKHVVGKKPTCYWSIQDRLYNIPVTIHKILSYQEVENMWLKRLLTSLTMLQKSFACIFQTDTDYFIIYKHDGQYQTLQSTSLCKDHKTIHIHYYIF